eukprot:12922233-Prorocentrum_lima.AAC.1
MASTWGCDHQAQKLLHGQLSLSWGPIGLVVIVQHLPVPHPPIQCREQCSVKGNMAYHQPLVALCPDTGPELTAGSEAVP